MIIGYLLIGFLIGVIVSSYTNNIDFKQDDALDLDKLQDALNKYKENIKGTH